MDRTILHCDCNGFYASVECILRPELRRGPMAVCGDPKERHGIILAKNEEAKRYGVQTAETVWQAKQKCPALTLVAPHRDAYAAYSEKVNAIYRRYTDLVEPFGIDESWLDVTGSRALFGPGKEIADTLRRVVRQELGLTISVGVSFNKIFAKLGSDYKKPDATTVIWREDVERIVYPLPAKALLFVGRNVADTLEKLGIRTIGDLAHSNRATLARHLGKAGEMLHDYANGKDDGPVRSAYAEREIKSIGNGRTFRRNLTTREDIRLAVYALCDTVAARMRRCGVECTTLQVQIRDPQFRTISRQRPLPAPTHLAREMADAALKIIADGWKNRGPIRMLTITGQHLIAADTAARQMSLFDTGEDERRHAKQEKIEHTMDAIRTRFGPYAIHNGSMLRNDLGLGTPMEPPVDE